MNGHALSLAGVDLTALPSGGLWWAAERLLCVSDLHLGKSERLARRGGALLPPYETAATLDRLDALIDGLKPRTLVCLGDSFDDRAAAEALDEAHRMRIARMQAGRRWIWIEGNHDPGPVDLGGAHRDELRLGPLTFRHIAAPAADGEISGHYHPKCGLARSGQVRPAFLVDTARIILPAFGAYTGGLRATDPVLQDLMIDPALAVLTGPRAVPLPMPRPDSAPARAGNPRPPIRHGRFG